MQASHCKVQHTPRSAILPAGTLPQLKLSTHVAFALHTTRPQRPRGRLHVARCQVYWNTRDLLKL
jgi:hypothetical protein